ncbi:hypothetical protein TNCT_219011 [Trichonephila clavata]|nr:hypothetical protein TNCT_687091 [Trichonephila clavata]GFR05119.1 hypothetical protein TNCT_219011 [Trichonephila clavata]
MFPAVLMMVSLVERASFVKRFYENKENASAAILEIHPRKSLLCGPMSTKGIRTMIKRFEYTDKLGIQAGRGCKR